MAALPQIRDTSASPGAVGVELLSTSSVALDARVRAGTGLYDDDVRIRNLGLGVGMSWY
jgi:hypothetical protein